jgi:putative transposase
MNRSITLTPDQRQDLMAIYRRDPDPDARRRAQILLLLSEGHTWAFVCSVMFCSSRTVSLWARRFRSEGTAALNPAPARPGKLARLGETIGEWVIGMRPGDFGLTRSRWSCSALALVLWWRLEIAVSAETVRRELHALGLAWRRPRPTLPDEDPDYAAIRERLGRLMRELPGDEAVVFQDEVDLNLNPEVGKMWMPKGCQAEVPTPGTNEKRYLAGSLSWRTGRVIAPAFGPKRDSELFVAHLEGLRVSMRRYKVVHVICDNAKFHDSRRVKSWLAEHGGRVKLHWLPKSAPELNPIERVWWHLREEITRNHRCDTIEELTDQTLEWLGLRGNFTVEDQHYELSRAA